MHTPQTIHVALKRMPEPEGRDEVEAPPCIYLALDFDGVLHYLFAGPSRLGVLTGEKTEAEHLQQMLDSIKAGKLMAYATDLAECLDRISIDVKIVIATGWRYYWPLEQILSMMPAQLAARVVGVLDQQPEANEGNIMIPGRRAAAMKRWIDAHAPHEMWLAIDDNADHWDGHRERLFETSSLGLHSRAEIADLERWLNRAAQLLLELLA